MPNQQERLFFSIVQSFYTMVFALLLTLPLHAGPEGHSLEPGQRNYDSVDEFSRAVVQADHREYADQLFLLTERVMLHPILYPFLNEVFAESLEIDAALQAFYGWPPKAAGLSSTQVMFILDNVKPHWADIRKFLDKVTEKNQHQKQIEEFRKTFREKADQVFKATNIIKKMNNLNDPAQPLILKMKGQRLGYSQISIFVNHPSRSEPENARSKLIPADDLKKVLIDFIAGAKSQLFVNFFEMNLLDVAQAIVDANKRGVSVIVGIDKNTVNNDERNQAVLKLLQNHKNPHFDFVLVDPTGLNHQKLVARDADTDAGAVLMLSGNATQSCIGKEGDLVHLPPALRPRESIPNANHAILIQGTLPAMVAKYELRKSLVLKLRGQSQFPISGSFLFQGPQDEVTGKDDFWSMAFSPNGGMGEVNRDLIKRVVLSTDSDVWSMQFAFSSPELQRAIEMKMEGEVRTSHHFEFRFVGDPPFAMQDWSVGLRLSGLLFNPANKLYEIDPHSVIMENLSGRELRNWQSRIRANPKMFGDFHATIDGKPEKITVKLHHKVFIFPQADMAVAGTSFNASENAEGNQEQLGFGRSRAITKRLMGAFMYLYDSSRTSLVDLAMRRNRSKNGKPELPTSQESREEISKVKGEKKWLTCPVLF